MPFKNHLLTKITALLFLLPAVSQASVTYSYTGLGFTVVDSWLYTNHNLLGDRNVFSFSFDNALGANLNMQSVGSLVTEWEAEALNTPKSKIGSTVANSTVDILQVSTDATGKITNWAIYLTGYTDDIYGNGILGKETFTAGLESDALTFYNPPGRISWPYRAGGSYGLAYCMGFSCVAANNSPWQMTTVSAVPLPSVIWLFLSGLFGALGLMRRKSII